MRNPLERIRSRTHDHFKRGARRRNRHSIQANDTPSLMWNSAGGKLPRCHRTGRYELAKSDSPFDCFTEEYCVLNEGILEGQLTPTTAPSATTGPERSRRAIPTRPRRCRVPRAPQARVTVAPRATPQRPWCRRCARGRSARDRPRQTRCGPGRRKRRARGSTGRRSTADWRARAGRRRS